MSEGRQRLDRWLFFARAVKSRTLAAKFVEAGNVRVNREKVTSPAHPLKPGDVLTMTLDRRVLVYRVVAPGARRGPATEARTLYEDLTPPAPRRDAAAEILPSMQREAGSGRPTKKDRRALDRLVDDD